MRQLPQKVVEGLTTKSSKIRALAEAGFERTEIRDFLKISYQHVRNVLIQSERHQGTATVRRKARETAPPSVAASGWPKERLLAAGFTLLGEWRSKDENSFGLSAIAPTEAGVYAFAVDGEVRYIGLTQAGIRTRMGHYVTVMPGSERARGSRHSFWKP